MTLLRRIALWTVIGVLACATLGYIFRNPVASFFFGRALDWRHGFYCSHPKLRVSADLRRISVTPFACDLGSSPVRHFDTGQATIFLHGVRPERVELDQATLDYRPRDVSHVQMNTVGKLTQAVGISDGFVKSMLDASAMYSLSGPVVIVNELIAKRGGKLESRMYGFHKSTHELWDRTQAARLEPAGQSAVTVRDLDMEVMPTRGQMRASVGVGGVTPVELHLRGEGLDGPAPRMQLSL